MAEEPWKPPTEFDLVKELNTQAGRLATLIGLVFTGSAFAANSPQVHDAIQASQMGVQLSFV
jgi:hypothetical protein